MGIQESSFKNHLALIVDDDQTSRSIAKRVITQLGFDVISADDGVSALELLQSNTPDIILLDVDMDCMNGIEACKNIREMPALASTPIIMMTSLDDADSIDDAFQAGATDFSIKPVNWTLLGHKIKYVMRNQEVLIELSNAEKISCIGNWRQPADSDTVSISNGLSILLGLENDQPIDVLKFVHHADRDFVQQKLSQLSSTEYASFNHRMITENKQEILVHHRAQALISYNGEFKGIFGSIQDITEKEKIDQKVRQLAYYDKLTNLANRTALIERLELLTQRSKVTQQRFALVHINIDKFRRINDSLGQATGDKLLTLLAKRLFSFLDAKGHTMPKQFLATEDVNEHSNLNMLARLGADEFAMVLVHDWDAKSIAEFSEYLLSQFGLHYQVDGRQLTISASIGIALYPEHGFNSQELSQNAEKAIHSVKLSGRNNFNVYDDRLSDAAQRKMLIEEHLRQALTNNELRLHYQPQIDLTTKQLCGVEALLRWNSVRLGAVRPIEFIPLAEEIGIIVPIGNWVLESACAQLAAWNKEKVNVKRMAINISIRQFNQDDFVEQVVSIVNQSGVNPTHLELELTESILAEDVPVALKKLEGLKALGVDISIDDFGTGYSSLSYLKKFPIDRLKIDQSFVRDIYTDKKDIAINKSIIGLANGLSLGVIAEGVETEEQLSTLVELGCDEAQGYLFSEPVADYQLVAWLREYDKNRCSHPAEKAA